MRSRKHNVNSVTHSCPKLLLPQNYSCECIDGWKKRRGGHKKGWRRRGVDTRKGGVFVIVHMRSFTVYDCSCRQFTSIAFTIMFF